MIVHVSHSFLPVIGIEVNLLSDGFAPGQKRFDRVAWCFKNRLNLHFPCIFAWIPAGSITCQ